MNTKTALIILHTGFEEIEAITTVDVLDRAGVRVHIASREKERTVVGRSRLTVLADVLLDEALEQGYDALILPGGPGTPNLLEDERILEAVRAQTKANKVLAAICAAPAVLGKAGILANKHYTSHPCVWNLLPEVDRRHSVLVDDLLITGNGPGAAIPFSLAIVECLLGKAQADQVAQDLGVQR